MSGSDTAPLFLTLKQVLAYHEQQIVLFGGARGLIDESLLLSALNQPQTVWCYDTSADLFDLGAVYAYHLSKNHPFRDGNKRVALQAGLAFLRVNGWRIDASETDMYDAMWKLVTDETTKRDFAAFLRDHAVRPT